MCEMSDWRSVWFTLKRLILADSSFFFVVCVDLFLHNILHNIFMCFYVFLWEVWMDESIITFCVDIFFFCAKSAKSAKINQIPKILVEVSGYRLYVTSHYC